MQNHSWTQWVVIRQLDQEIKQNLSAWEEKYSLAECFLKCDLNTSIPLYNKWLSHHHNPQLIVCKTLHNRKYTKKR